VQVSNRINLYAKLISSFYVRLWISAREYSALPHRNMSGYLSTSWQLLWLQGKYALIYDKRLSNEDQSVSNPDSFIEEFTEEVRRDRLYGYMRKYGWIAVLVVVTIVGGSAWYEYNKAQSTAKAQAAGDALFAALSENDPAARADALAGVTAQGDVRAITELLNAAAQHGAGDLIAAHEILTALAEDQTIPEDYRTIAALKAAMIDAPEIDQTARRQMLESMSNPGMPFSLLALEQTAMMDVAAGEIDAAIATFRAIAEDASATRGLRERAQSMIVALGAELSEE
jgi:hypothetical protein